MNATDEATYRDQLPLLSNGELVNCLRAHAEMKEQRTITALIMEALARVLLISSDPERDIHGNRCIGNPASSHTVVAVHEPDTIGCPVTSQESGQNTIFIQKSKGAINTLGAVGYLSAEERNLELLMFHENIHDQLHALRMQPQLTLLNQILLPGQHCPFCERHINEHPGPILGVDGIADRPERPPLIKDDRPQPFIKNLSRHQGEHGSSSNEVTHDSEP